MKPEKQLYQWDTNQLLVGLTPSAQFVDYPIGDEVIRIKADGTRCRIPDEVLQTYGGKTCYERYPDGTYRAYSFTVLYAPKPPDYVYTPEERTTFEALTARVDAAIDEIKRRADSGEFTPKKGVDYFTDAEKNELMESVSSGAVGEFRKVVDSATTEYNDNHNLKLAKYNDNASEKLTTYDTNAEQHTSDYNRNAAENLEAYNQNHAAKVAEYNQNAETKTAEFDANAAALQTEVDRLRGECDNLAAENRKQENRIDALIKLNKGQTFDILPEEGESASRTAPSGAKYVSVDMVGGKSVVWNQLVNPLCLRATSTKSGLTFTNNGDGSITVSGTATSSGNIRLSAFYDSNAISVISGHKHYCKLPNVIERVTLSNDNNSISFYNENQILSMNVNGAISYDLYFTSGVTYNYTFKPQMFDLTAMFGAGNEPSTVEEFEAMFPADYYPYCEPTIISSQTDRVDVRGKNIWNDDEASFSSQYWVRNGRVYKSDKTEATYVYQDVELDVGTYTISAEITSLVNDTAKLQFRNKSGSVLTNKNSSIVGNVSLTHSITEKDIYRVLVGGLRNGSMEFSNVMLTQSSDTAYSPYSLQQITTGFPVLNSAGSVYDYIDLNEGKLYTWTYIDGNEIKALTEPVITEITIPTELTDWLTVEAGGSVTFHDADETKQLAVPNAVSWVRKLDEVN